MAVKTGGLGEAAKLAKLEKLRRLQMRVWQKEPMTWLKERFGEDPALYKWSMHEGYDNHVWDGDPDALFNAWQDLANGQWAAIESGTGLGKTFICSRIIFWFLDVFENSFVITTAPKEGQLKEGVWKEIDSAFHKFKAIRKKAVLTTLRLAPEYTDLNASDHDNEDRSRSKSWLATGIVAGVGADEESAVKMQGKHAGKMLFILEECPGIPSAVMTAIINTCSDPENNLIFAIGNPDNQLDSLHVFTKEPGVKKYTLSCFDHPNVVLKRKVIEGATTQAFIDRMYIKYGKDANMYQSRVRGRSPKQSLDSLIQLSWLERARERGRIKKEAGGWDGGYHACGADIANSVDGDKACLAWGRGNLLDKLQDFYCDNANHLAYNIVMTEAQLLENAYTSYNTEKAYDYNLLPGFIGVDTVGVGVASYNVLKDMGWEPQPLSGGPWTELLTKETYIDEHGKEKEIYSVKFQNLRSQMGWELREDFRLDRIDLYMPDDNQFNEFAKECTVIRYVEKQNYIAIEGKPEIKKRLSGVSPNKFDAAMYWNWTRKGYRIMRGGLPVR